MVFIIFIVVAFSLAEHVFFFSTFVGEGDNPKHRFIYCFLIIAVLCLLFFFAYLTFLEFEEIPFVFGIVQ